MIGYFFVQKDGLYGGHFMGKQAGGNVSLIASSTWGIYEKKYWNL
ncbi:hypothetical protein [Enterococcus rivorum]|nr:hypothetical protein [Enterococcus rivorum]